MNPWLVLGPSMLLVTGTLIGLLVRGRWRLSRFFATYLAVVLLYGILTLGWQQRFWGPRSYMVFQGLEDLLKLAIGLEVTRSTFRLFRGAQRTSRRLTLAILASTAAWALIAETTTSEPFHFTIAIGIVSPRVQCGVLWLMVATLAIAWWYRVPIHPYHVVLLTSFALCQAFYGALFTTVAFGFNREYISVLDNAAF